MKLYAVGLSGLAVAGVVFIAAFTSLAPARWITTALSGPNASMLKVAMIGW